MNTLTYINLFNGSNLQMASYSIKTLSSQRKFSFCTTGMLDFPPNLALHQQTNGMERKKEKGKESETCKL